MRLRHSASSACPARSADDPVPASRSAGVNSPRAWPEPRCPRTRPSAVWSGSVRNAVAQRGSTLVIVLWIAFGLVSITLYFAHAMSFELRASDNRVTGLAADQAIEGAARYVNYLLANQVANGSNGILLDPAFYPHEGVTVGEAHFWLIGRDTNEPPTHLNQLFFGLVDEASKLNLNTATSNMLSWLPRMTLDLAAAILDWRDTNGGSASQMYYAMLRPPYQCKSAPFETVDELRLVFGATMDILVGEDVNRNGILDENENDENRNGLADPGVLEYFTVYSREPNTRSDGSQRISVRSLTSTSSGQLSSLLQTNLGAARAGQILSQLGLASTGGRGGRGGGGGGGAPVTRTFRSPLQFYAQSGMTADEFAKVANDITVSSGACIEGRVNVNTASVTVLACLLGGSTDLAQQLVNYRVSNPDKLTSVAWVADALGQNNPDALQTLQAGDYLTTRSYQYTADVAALGPYGRGYRRTHFVFDTSEGAPIILYRQDLSHLGWALGKTVRATMRLANETR